MPSQRIRFVLASLIIVAGCKSSPSSRPTGSDGRTPLPAPSSGVIGRKQPAEGIFGLPEVRAIRKKVNGKEDPSTLIAIDRSSCIVPADKFKDTKIGDTVFCDWSTGDRAP